LDWSAWNVQNDPTTEALTAPGTGADVTGGFAKAVEMCNNNGHCRKFDAGTMCPSYRVTRDEQHLTRGRANTLRLALSGQLGKEALTGQPLYDTLDLCVGCKGCKRDCPTGVDMARMKIEFLSHYKARHGYTVRDRLIGELPEYAARGSRVPWLMNLRDTVPGAAWVSEKLLRLAARRSLPKWRSDTFWSRSDRTLFSDAQATLEAAVTGGKAAVLFVDTFNGTFESENAWAAARVLRAAGYTVHSLKRAVGHYCCGRTYLSCGMVQRARSRVGELVDALLPFARAGVPVVGLEPSCLLTLRDEALVLGLGERAQVVSKSALLWEEFLAREARAGRFAASFNSIDVPIMVHGHCHQKAFGAVSPILEVLRLIPGAAPALIESSCCGMAGAFGYESSHYEVSMQMAELSLLPAIRAAAPRALVIADGTSCRHQIHDGAGREALHVARLLERQLLRERNADIG
jgi:Fe-S oxidoreductase